MTQHSAAAGAAAVAHERYMVPVLSGTCGAVGVVAMITGDERVEEEVLALSHKPTRCACTAVLYIGPTRSPTASALPRYTPTAGWRRLAADSSPYRRVQDGAK